jgi:hypothetical protein
MRARVRLGLVVLTLLTAAVASLGLTSPASAATTPGVGQCHQLSWRQAAAYSDTKAPVGCSKRHNLETLAVVTSPTSLAGLSDDQLRQAESACFHPYWKAMGKLTKLRQTSYSLFTFVPTAAQREAGERWIRCDVALVKGGNRMASLPRHRLGKPVVRALNDTVRLCLTGKHRWMTTCDTPHSYRSTKAFSMAQTTYPTDDQAVKAAWRRCSGTTDYATWPSEEQWDVGNHVIVCYDKTKK